MEIVLLWCFVLAYFAKQGAEDLVHAVKGTPNPRYELKRERARAAGQASPSQPRYGTRQWFADLYSDALVAHTEKRRRTAAARAQPVDDMVDVVREPRRDRDPYDPNNTRNCTTCGGSVVLDGRPCPRCLAEQQRRNAEWEAEHGRWDARRKPGEPEWLTPGFDEVAFLAEGRQTCPVCRVGLLAEMSDGSTRCPNCEPFDVAREAPEFMRATEEQKEDPMPIGGESTREFGDKVAAALLSPPQRCQRCRREKLPQETNPLCSGCQLELDALYEAAKKAVAELDPAGARNPAVTEEIKKRVKAGDRYGWLEKDVADFVHLAQMEASERAEPDTRPLAPVINLFPNINQLKKEIDMSNPEATGLPTAIAFAEAAAQAHASFSTAGSEGYAGALERMGFGEGITALAADAREKSTMAADSWKALADAMEQFQTGREFYASNPDAPDKVALVNE